MKPREISRLIRTLRHLRPQQAVGQARRMLRSRGFVVYLKTSIEKQLKRLSQDKSRPLLRAEDKQQRLLDLAQARNHLYDATADLVFSTRNSSVSASAKSLSSAIAKLVDTLKPEAPDADS